ncbi:hypothetical protein ACJX0J_008082, partial [Zea mays]
MVLKVLMELFLFFLFFSLGERAIFIGTFTMLAQPATMGIVSVPVAPDTTENPSLRFLIPPLGLGSEHLREATMNEGVVVLVTEIAGLALVEDGIVVFVFVFVFVS